VVDECHHIPAAAFEAAVRQAVNALAGPDRDATAAGPAR
jgi:hypothetical protein